MRKNIIAAIWLVILIFSFPIYSQIDTLFPILQNEKWGYMDWAGKIVIKPQYLEARPFFEGLALVSDDWGWYYIDKTGKDVWWLDITEFYADDRDGLSASLGSFSEGLACVVNKDFLSGFIDKTGIMRISPQFSEASNFSEGLSAVEVKGKNVYIDKAGKIIIDAQFIAIHSFSEGLAAVCPSDKWEYIDKTGKIIIPAKFDKAGAFSEGMAKIAIKDQGSKSTPPTWFGDMLFRGKWGYIDKTGEILIIAQFDEASEFSEGLAAVNKAGKWGYIGKTGKMLIGPQFDKASRFSEGVAAVKMAGKWGYVDKTGKMLISPQFDDAWPFAEGMAMVWIGNKMGYIVKSGNFFWGPSN